MPGYSIVYGIRVRLFHANHLLHVFPGARNFVHLGIQHLIEGVGIHFHELGFDRVKINAGRESAILIIVRDGQHVGHGQVAQNAGSHLHVYLFGFQLCQVHHHRSPSIVNPVVLHVSGCADVGCLHLKHQRHERRRTLGGGHRLRGRDGHGGGIRGRRRRHGRCHRCGLCVSGSGCRLCVSHCGGCVGDGHRGLRSRDSGHGSGLRHACCGLGRGGGGDTARAGTCHITSTDHADGGTGQPCLC
mmetsp:Transcript_137433/g.194476  ORF Transcript_137433/g.194476 Transcript_137433/m.194476 type:complete len:244 (-) Transcript_137433:190-921(-)